MYPNSTFWEGDRLPDGLGGEMKGRAVLEVNPVKSLVRYRREIGQVEGIKWGIAASDN